jgi:succinylarginine dihydrolase
VRSYLFNSQLVSPPDGTTRLICAQECRERPAVSDYLDNLVADPANPIKFVHVFDLRQSMQNGGGPACLRLRVPLGPAEHAAVNPRCWMSAEKYVELREWITRHYRDRLTLADLADPQLLDESRRALDLLTRLLGLGAIYDFQRTA